MEHAVEHGEDDLLLGLGESADAPELALELGGRPALAGMRVCLGDARGARRWGTKEGGERGHKRDGEAKAADLVVCVPWIGGG